MTAEAVDRIARAVLYEGYLLYPYRTSDIKNRQRFTFGGLYPPAFDTAVMQTQCLVEGDDPQVSATIRFLQLVDASQGQDRAETVIERALPAPGRVAFPPLEGSVSLTVEPVAPDVRQVTVRIENTSAYRPRDRDEALRHALLSTHTVLEVAGGSFVSMTDPPQALKELAAVCRSTGAWPVLVGEAGRRDTMLSSPIILEDYPRVAEESPGDLFDATEIDELLSLSILSLSDDEKEEMRRTDERARKLLERTEALTPEDLMRLHGAMRSMRPLFEEH